MFAQNHSIYRIESDGIFVILSLKTIYVFAWNLYGQMVKTSSKLGFCFRSLAKLIVGETTLRAGMKLMLQN